ncbi:hypothetical protein SCLCIDRAFT_917523 [Scleroderma citrinum Foug A]|uniref:Uncharacterized protein n=1 Tax=Scleroderma citrinum Foug A TaxID=1036808 RepID=A0A0C3DXV2_9AGAM|nr:hypothetical protein SCLCIDRAFT_917523 [Scleroderma citrinum Foug A]
MERSLRSALTGIAWPCTLTPRLLGRKSLVHHEFPTFLSTLLPASSSKRWYITMGSVCSVIGTGVNAIIAAFANLLITIVGAITTVVTTIFDVITDVLCFRCCSQYRRTGSKRIRRRRDPYWSGAQVSFPRRYHAPPQYKR